MRLGISLPIFTDAATLVDLAVEAEAAGWDGVFLWDHLVWVPEQRLDVQDPWVLLGAMAARTERVRLGTLITPLARRRPWVVAKHLTTLDHLTGGRAVLGVGLGEPPDADFEAFGDPGAARARASRLDDGLALLDGLLRGPVEHRGPHYTVTSELRPRPVQQPRPPIWVAAIAPNRRPLERAARWDGVVPIVYPAGTPTPDELMAYVGGVDRPAEWDVVAFWRPGVPADEYAAVGATWLVETPWPDGDWVAETRARLAKGP